MYTIFNFDVLYSPKPHCCVNLYYIYMLPRNNKKQYVFFPNSLIAAGRLPQEADGRAILRVARNVYFYNIFTRAYHTLAG